MRNIKYFIFMTLTFTLCVYVALAQQNNSPVIYRISNIGLASARNGTLQLIDPFTSNQIREIALSISSRNIELSRDQRKAYIASNNFLSGALLVSLTNNDDSVTPLLT